MSPRGFDGPLMERVKRVLDYPSSNFLQLVRIAGLNPARDFRHLDLSRVDFASCDLEGFDFRGSILKGAKFRGASIRGAIFDKKQLQLPELVGALDYRYIFGAPSNEYSAETEERRREQFLHACLTNDITSIRSYVALGIDLDEEAMIGTAMRTALIHAATRRPAYVGIPATGPEFLLRAGANPSYAIKEDGYNALLPAAYNGDTELVRLLLSYGANPNAKVKDGRTPLSVALQKNEFKAALLLLEAGADLAAALQNIGELDNEQKSLTARLKAAVAAKGGPQVTSCV